MSLKRQAAGGVFWNLVNSGTIAVLQFAYLAMLARLVTKADFGVMALVAVVAGFARVWVDLGLGNAIVQRQELTRDQLSTLLWLGLGMGALVWLVLSAIAPWLAGYYAEPVLGRLVMLVGATFLVFPVANQYLLLLTREMRFRSIALAEILAKAAAVGVTLALAAAGHGPWSIAWGMLVSEFMRAALMCAFGLNLFRPRLTFQPRTLSELKSFGLFQLGTRMVQSFIQELDVLIIGKVIGRDGVGVYSYAKQLVLAPILMIVPVVTQVSFPTMARVQADAGRFRGIFLRSLRTVAFLVFPVCGLLMVTADEVVILCFGRAWGATLLIVQILAIFAALRAVAMLLGVMMNACGRMRRQFLWNLAQLVLVPVTMIPLADRGLTGVAWGWTGLQLALVLPGWLVLVRPVCGAALREYVSLFLAPLAVSALVVVAGYAAQTPFAGHLARLAAAGAAGGAILLAANAWANRDLAELLRRGPRAEEGLNAETGTSSSPGEPIP